MAADLGAAGLAGIAERHHPIQGLHEVGDDIGPLRKPRQAQHPVELRQWRRQQQRIAGGDVEEILQRLQAAHRCKPLATKNSERRAGSVS
jgi:hypothetical protein